ncbi:MAG: hypothetical protein ACOYOK_08110 [Pseudobdellovibrionaceae bacterium]
MKHISPKDIFKVAPPGRSVCLSIYLNHPDELKSLIYDAKKVASADLDEATIDQLIKPVMYLLKNKKWNTKAEPTGIFITKGFAGYIKIPFEVKSVSVVSSSFHVKPILKWLQKEKPFFLLEFKAKEALLFCGGLTDLKLSESIQYASARTADQIIDQLGLTVMKKVTSMQQPLILSGDPEKIRVFKSIFSYKFLLQESIELSTKEESLENLRLKCLEMLEPYVNTSEALMIKKYWNAKKLSQTTCNLKQIVELAIQGQVKHLYVNEKMHLWGLINYKTAEFTYNYKQQDAYDDDILDDLAEIVLYHKGTVTVLASEKMPESHAAAAIIRPRNYKRKHKKYKNVIPLSLENHLAL